MLKKRAKRCLRSIQGFHVYIHTPWKPIIKGAVFVLISLKVLESLLRYVRTQGRQIASK